QEGTPAGPGAQRVVLYNDLTAFNAQCPFVAYACQAPAGDSIRLEPVQPGRAVTLAYFSGREGRLYERIKNGGLIERAFIDTLDLTRLLDSGDRNVSFRSFTLRYPLLFKRCVIGAIKFPVEAMETTTGGGGQDTSFDVVFSRKISFIDPYLQGAFQPKGTFRDSLFLFNLVAENIFFRRSTFSTCFIGYRMTTPGTTTVHVTFDNGCAFRNALYIRNLAPEASLTLSWNYFGGPVLLGNTMSERDGEPLVDRDYVNGRYLVQNMDKGDRSFYKRRRCYNLDFSYSTFRKKFSLRNTSAEHLSVNQCKFMDTLDLYNNVGLDSPSGFPNIWLLKSNVILVNIDNAHIYSLGLNNSSLAQANIVYPLDVTRKGYVLTGDTLDRINDFYDQCIAWAQNAYQKDHPNLASELADRFAHDEILCRIVYYRT